MPFSTPFLLVYGLCIAVGVSPSLASLLFATLINFRFNHLRPLMLGHVVIILHISTVAESTTVCNVRVLVSGDELLIHPIRKFILSHQPFFPISKHPCTFPGFNLLNLVHFLEEVVFLIAPSNHSVDLLIRRRFIQRLIVVFIFQKVFQKLLPLFRVGLIIEHSSLDDLGVNIQFPHGGRQNFFFDRVERNESKHPNLLLLSNTVRPVLGLKVHLWIPIAVE
mmetsp:Transcript_47169/g.118803  ORF Transcript_47169/g.118803 Transcript_47169/m.118803 type:complete len:222 (+) Transcript_47169:817-1482(+)